MDFVEKFFGIFSKTFESKRIVWSAICGDFSLFPIHLNVCFEYEDKIGYDVNGMIGI